MAGITLETAKKHLEMWLEAEEALSTSQSYTIGTRTLTRASLAEVRKSIEYWQNKVAAIEATQARRGRSRVYRAVPRDL